MNSYRKAFFTLLIVFVLLIGLNTANVSYGNQIIYQNTTIKLNDILKFKSTDDCKVIGLNYDVKFFKLTGSMDNEFNLTSIKKGNTNITFVLQPPNEESATLVEYMKVL
ncbi:MAG: hypothetical protein PHY59_00970 [Methanobacterium sp.]|nr:hypothetical protein [Methanobacterium sp.]